MINTKESSKEFLVSLEIIDPQKNIEELSLGLFETIQRTYKDALRTNYQIIHLNSNWVELSASFWFDDDVCPCCNKSSGDKNAHFIINPKNENIRLLERSEGSIEIKSSKDFFSFQENGLKIIQEKLEKALPKFEYSFEDIEKSIENKTNFRYLSENGLIIACDDMAWGRRGEHDFWIRCEDLDGNRITDIFKDLKEEDIFQRLKECHLKYHKF